MAVAFIPGASTGIGLGTAILFARRGCRVYAGARRPAGSTGLQRAIDEGLPITPSYSTSMATGPFALRSRVWVPWTSS